MKTATTLINEIKLRGNFPSDGDFLYKDDYEILTLLNSVLKYDIVPFYIENEPSYFLTKENIPIGSKRLFTIPPQAHNRRLYEVRLLHPNGNEENIPYSPFKNAASSTNSQPGMRILNNTLELINYSDAINHFSLQLWYHRKSFELVLDTSTVPLVNSYTHTTFQRFENTTTTFPFQLNEAVFVQNKLDPSLFYEDTISFIDNATQQFGLNRTDSDSNFRYTPDNIICPYKKLNIPELPEVAIELLILKTLMSMSLTTETRYRIRDQLKQQMTLFKDSLKKRVRLETPTKNQTSPLW